MTSAAGLVDQFMTRNQCLLRGMSHGPFNRPHRYTTGLGRCHATLSLADEQSLSQPL